LARLHRELKQPGVTLQRLHLKYLPQHPTGYRYTHFCRDYGRAACGPVTVTANCIQSDTYPSRHL
jgi:hypothetical protein